MSKKKKLKQKLDQQKRINDELTKDIIILVESQPARFEVRSKWLVRLAVERGIWAGDFKESEERDFCKPLPKVNKTVANNCDLFNGNWDEKIGPMSSWLED